MEEGEEEEVGWGPGCCAGVCDLRFLVVAA